MPDIDDAIDDVNRSATVAACRGRHHLLDFEEWMAVDEESVPA